MLLDRFAMWGQIWTSGRTRRGPGPIDKQRSSGASRQGGLIFVQPVHGLNVRSVHSIFVFCAIVLLPGSFPVFGNFQIF